MNIKLDIGNIFQQYDLNGSDSFTAEKIDKLEELITACNKAENEGTELVADAIYDKMIDILKQVKPDSSLLSEVWSEASEDTSSVSEERKEMLRKHPMKSINTAKSFDCAEYRGFLEKLPEGIDFTLHASYKENGHGVGLAYKKGHLVNGTSRGRGLEAGLDKTRQLQVILGEYNESLADIDFIEIRGEIVLPFDNFEYAKANYNPNLVSAFTGVSAMFCDSATDEMLSLLRFRAYQAYSEDLSFETKSDEYTFLEEHGFTTPDYSLSGLIQNYEADEVIRGIVENMANALDNSNYEDFTDGLVIEVNERDIFKQMGTTSKYNFGNVAMKVGRWEQNMLTGFVQAILWSEGKTKLSPVALVSEDIDDLDFDYDLEDAKIIAMRDGEWVAVRNLDSIGVMALGGNRVKRVPLYEPKNIKLLGAYIGEQLNFKYGGEAGVVPCYPDGSLLTSDAIKNVISDEDDWYSDWYE